MLNFTSFLFKFVRELELEVQMQAFSPRKETSINIWTGYLASSLGVLSRRCAEPPPAQQNLTKSFLGAGYFPCFPLCTDTHRQMEIQWLTWTSFRKRYWSWREENRSSVPHLAASPVNCSMAPAFTHPLEGPSCRGAHHACGREAWGAWREHGQEGKGRGLLSVPLVS